MANETATPTPGTNAGTAHVEMSIESISCSNGVVLVGKLKSPFGRSYEYGDPNDPLMKANHILSRVIAPESEFKIPGTQVTIYDWPIGGQTFRHPFGTLWLDENEDFALIHTWCSDRSGNVLSSEKVLLQIAKDVWLALFHPEQLEDWMKQP